MSSFKGKLGLVKNFHIPRFDAPGKTSQVENLVFQPLSVGEKKLGRPRDFVQEARQVLEDARLKAQHLEREAYEEGFRQGLESGREVGEKSLEQSLKRCSSLAEALEKEKTELYARRERDLVELIQIISRKVIDQELKTQPEAISNLLARGFRLLAQQEEIKLRVHPQDYELLKQAPRPGWPTGVELVADGTITPGGLIFSTQAGEIDATRESRWAAVAQTVAEALK